MENLLKYYEFSDFFSDDSNVFSGNLISYTSLNENHFLIFEKRLTTYNLYVAKYHSKKEIGIKEPEIIEELVTNYSKSIPAHRLILKQYF